MKVLACFYKPLALSTKSLKFVSIAKSEVFHSQTGEGKFLFVCVCLDKYDYKLDTSIFISPVFCFLDTNKMI